MIQRLLYLLLLLLVLCAAAGWSELPKEQLYFLQQVLNSVQVSSFYALLAVAYVLIYGIANRINLAFGALAMSAGYLTITGITIAVALTPLRVAIIVLIALVYVLFSTALLGYVVQRLVVKPLLAKASPAILIATIGVAIALEEIVRIANNSREPWLPPLFDGALILVRSKDFPIQMPYTQAVVLAAALILSLALVVFFAKHNFGKAWRACSQDPGMAALCGIRVDTVLAVSFVISSAYAAAAGAIIALYYGNVSFTMGAMLGLKALLAAVIGGLSSIGGAVLGAFFLGFLESLWSAYLDLAYRDVAVVSILTILLIWRPQGLLTPLLRRDSN